MATGKAVAAGGANIGIEERGAAQLARTLRKAGADLNDLKNVNRQAADIVAPAAKGLAPKRSGKLAGSVRAGATRKAGVVRAGNSGRIRYAGVINYGWPKHNIKPTLFINSAAKSTEPAWSALYSQAVDKIIADIKGA
jgi:hypothetical protein